MVFTSAILSLSLRFAVASTYFSTASLYSGVVISETNSCSGARVMNDTPKIVSGRVVKTPIPLAPEGGIMELSKFFLISLKTISMFPRTSSFRKRITL